MNSSSSIWRQQIQAQVDLEQTLGCDWLPRTMGASLPAVEPGKAEALAKLEAEHVRVCTKCDLCRTRRHTVFGEGDPDAELMFIGEAPGADEDRLGRPFVGRAGKQLDRQIQAMGLRRQDVYIANTIKCRPPDNRTPTVAERSACWGYLEKQIDLIAPKVLCCLGAPAAQQILNSTDAIGLLRGVWKDYRGIPVMCTYHPSYLIRGYNLEGRKRVWSDLQQIMARLGLPTPNRPD